MIRCGVNRMTKRNVCIDSSWPKDSMRVEVSTENSNESMYVSEEIFKFLFGVEAKEGLFLEVDIEDITEQRGKKIREIHDRMGARGLEGYMDD